MKIHLQIYMDIYFLFSWVHLRLNSRYMMQVLINAIYFPEEIVSFIFLSVVFESTSFFTFLLTGDIVSL